MTNEVAVKVTSAPKQYDYVIFIGRFQPWHLAHQAVALQALNLGKKLIIVLGSRDRARTIENPWTADERRDFIRASLSQAAPERHRDGDILFAAVPDRLYNNTVWYNSINTSVKQIIFSSGGSDDSKICMIGHYKDKGSFWLDKFPQWDLVNVDGVPNFNSTDVRRVYFSEHYMLGHKGDLLNDKLSDCLQMVLEAHYQQYPEWYATLCGEMEFVRKYKEQFAHLKYGVKHVTVDAIVFCAGHVLLIRRRSFPGKGLWALPGGHLEMDEDINEYASIRELMEETGLKVPLKVLEGSLRGEKVFGHPRRSLIGRVITHSYFFELDLPHDGKFPYVKGMDDADKARWVPINEVKEWEMFDDHYQVIQYWLGRATKK